MVPLLTMKLKVCFIRLRVITSDWKQNYCDLCNSKVVYPNNDDKSLLICSSARVFRNLRISQPKTITFPGRF